MGCVNGKSYSSSSPPSRHSERLKREHGYAHRVSTQKPIPQNDLYSRSRSHQPAGFHSETKNNASVGGGGVRAGGRGEGGERAISRETAKQNSTGVGNVSKRFMDKKIGRDEVVGGWPKWLVDNIPSNVLDGLIPKSADSFEKLAKVGRGTYSNVYKARDKDTRKIVALKKVRFDTSDSESIKFMAREIMILQKLDHPNIIKLEGLATSRMQYSLYLVFDYMQSDLTRIISRPGEKLTEAQVKCYMMQLLAGLQHCHDRGVMHRDIKASNLLIDKRGVLKIADFGLANSFDLKPKGPLTNRVVTLWYRAPELLLGSTDYGFGIDLWSAGCLLAEMFIGRPIMPGRTEVEQIHMIFKLCGSPPEDYWKKLKLMTSYRPPQHYKPNYVEAFRSFPPSSLGLLTTLLDLDPTNRGTAASALQSEFFKTSPLACDLSALPVIYNDEDERSQTKRQKRHNKTSKRGRILQTNHVSKSGKNQTDQLRRDSESSKEEKNSSSTSSGSKVFNEASTILSPVSVSSDKRFPRTEAHPNALKNIKNYALLQASMIERINRNEGNDFAPLRRSFSVLEARLHPVDFSNLLGVDKKWGHRI